MRRGEPSREGTPRLLVNDATLLPVVEVVVATAFTTRG
jgi:hypothetical protein